MTAPDSGIVNIHGKQYETVASRVQRLRADKPDWEIRTEVLHRDAECVVMRAEIANEAGRVLGTGHAEEYRDTSTINRTSALENCETSAIGRALAAAGYAGTEFASADELKRAIVDKKEAKPGGDKRSRVPTEAQDKAIADFCAAIETADSLESLKIAWEGAFKVVSTWDLPMMVNLIESAKNKRKRDLTAKEVKP